MAKPSPRAPLSDQIAEHRSCLSRHSVPTHPPVAISWPSQPEATTLGGRASFAELIPPAKSRNAELFAPRAPFVAELNCWRSPPSKGNPNPIPIKHFQELSLTSTILRERLYLQCSALTPVTVDGWIFIRDRAASPMFSIIEEKRTCSPCSSLLCASRIRLIWICCFLPVLVLVSLE